MLSSPAILGTRAEYPGKEKATKQLSRAISPMVDDPTVPEADPGAHDALAKTKNDQQTLHRGVVDDEARDRREQHQRQRGGDRERGDRPTCVRAVGKAKIEGDQRDLVAEERDAAKNCDQREVTFLHG